MGSSGLEPPTSRLSGVRSNQLSYEPIFASYPGHFSVRKAQRVCFAFFLQLEKVGGDERVRTDDPLLAKQVLSQLSYTPLPSLWWVWLDLNQRPHAYQACALTN